MPAVGGAGRAAGLVLVVPAPAQCIMIACTYNIIQYKITYHDVI